MEIVDILAERLFSFVYKVEGADGDSINEFDRLMNLWTDVSYLRQYAINNKVFDINQFIHNRLQDAENIQDLLEEIALDTHPLEYYFRPLNNYETDTKILSLQKGKTSNKDGLRLYAVRIDDNCFVITGGAIKMSQAMQDHPDTSRELSKIKRAQAYLQKNGVFDSDSFYEFKNEWE